MSVSNRKTPWVAPTKRDSADLAFDIVNVCDGPVPDELMKKAKKVMRQAKNGEITDDEAMHILLTMDLGLKDHP
ncbi:hypothetical protein MNBD_GAMMA12-2197 [hydrothermal vent metagenome]|uniref:Uncharacterized protein n=1 Tax=hydrothermal vent metagenome TaxID=652676 RepID=A0A3B0YAI9_9ZZZZ